MAKKYIDADRLKAGIEGIRWFPQISSGYNDGREDMKIMVLDIIDSLQQEQQEVDLEEEADRLFFSLGWYEGDHDQPMLDCVSLKEFRGIARHFYELGRLNARKEENK